MAFGITPHHTEEIPLEGLTREQCLVLAVEVARELGWVVDYLSENGLLAHTGNGMFSWNAEMEIRIEGETMKLKSSSTGSEMFDMGRNRKNLAKFLHAFLLLKVKSTDEELFERYDELKADFTVKGVDILTLPPPSAGEKLASMLSIFVPSKGYFITPILIDLNILLFLAMTISGVNILLPDSDSLLKWGANFRPQTLNGEWWRLLSCCFLHIGILHLLLNMYALLYIGLLLEPILGRIRFLAAYLITGIASSVASLWWHELIISAGASGAIFGMYGLFLALLTTDILPKTARKALMVSIVIFVGYNLMNGVKGGIDNAAHIGGLLSGLAIGYAFVPSLKQPDNRSLRNSVIGIIAFIVLAASAGIYKSLPNDVVRYDEEMQKFANNESLALEVFRMSENTPKHIMISEINSKGIYYFNENLRLLESFDRMELPPAIRERNRKLKEYCRLRIQCFEWIAKAIDEDTDKYDMQINGCSRRLEEVLLSLNEKK